MSNLMENRPVVADTFCVDQQPGMMESVVAFRNFASALTV
jgi:hypothetical protein